MNTLISGVLHDLQKTIPAKTEIKVDDLQGSKGDYTLISQVMVNLLSNAIKYSSGKEHPVVEIYSEEKDGSIVYTVKDNGAGFDMRYVNKLFGVFQRLHSSKEFEGTGVGLAIVHRIVEKHGGEIWAEAELGHGASFHFLLPLS
jgi:light-regulated signal transduction histidine kinase (bacteriophytochrome)